MKMSGVKRKLNTLSLSDKLRLISEIDKGGKKKKVIAAEFGIPANTLSTILKNRGEILKKAEDGACNERKRFKTCTYEDIDAAVLEWMKMVRDKNLAISGPLIREKALFFAESLGYQNFVASVGWLDKFKRRHNIMQKVMCGESADVSDQDCENWRQNVLPGLLASYREEDIFNADETGLFFKCLPDKTLTFKNEKCFGGKHNKDRITVMVCSNMSGTEKLNLLVIGKSKNPRCFRGNTFLPVTYRNNKKAWMTSEAYEEWLSNLDKKFYAEKRKILLFVDNCPSHPKITKALKSIRVVFLPPNMTSKLQPMDQGIINNLKQHYRKRILRKTLAAMEDGDVSRVTLLDAISILSKAWNSDVQQATIKNCFTKAGFKKEVQSDWEEEDDTPLSELRSLFDMYSKKVTLGVPLEEYISFDDDLVVAGYPTDAEIIEGVKINKDNVDLPSDDDETVEVPVPPSNKEMRQFLSKFNDYLYSKCHVTNDVYRALTTLENFVESELFQQKQSKITDFFQK